MRNEQWQMNRAGLVNFWYYDEETFEFEDGKLLLRGANGSGKSVTMQSFLPVLLDGKKSPDRLDPFGSKARKMEDYLLGEKDVVDRDERTGYLFIEYRKKGTDQFMTTGIGMQAKRNKQMKSWYFVLTDNRRIGKDLELSQQHAGEKIPLSEKELSNRIGTGGQVVNTQKEYIELVNRHVFGFQSIEAYEDLIKLLIQLRSPKLSKDFKPTVIYEILESALPPLTDDEIRYLSDTIDQMDQAEQQLAKLEQEKDSMNRLVRAYDRYNQYILAEKASKWKESEQRARKLDQAVKEQAADMSKKEKEMEQLEGTIGTLKSNKELLEEQKDQLQQHEVWSLEKRKVGLQHELKSKEAEAIKVDGKRDKKQRAYRDKLDEQELVEMDETKENQNKKDQLLDLADFAEEAQFKAHEVNHADFERMNEREFDFSIWKKEVQDHQSKLENVRTHLDQKKQLQQRYQELERESSEAKQSVDYTLQELEKTEQFFTEEQQNLEYAVFNWIKQHEVLAFTTEDHQQISRHIYGFYEDAAMSHVTDILTHRQQTYLEKVQRHKLHIEAEKKNRLIERAEKETQLNELKKQKMIEPTRSEGTIDHRKTLDDTAVASIPFYEAVEFKSDLSEEVKSRIESVLNRTGLLDSLIVSQPVVPKQDTVLTTNPHMLMPTLADYLLPDVEDVTGVSQEQVEEILQSIPLQSGAESGTFSIDIDGSYQMGIMIGHAPNEGAARFIGRSSRKRYLKEQMEQMQEEISRLTEEIERLDTTLTDLVELEKTVRSWAKTYPGDQDLQELQNVKVSLEATRKEQQNQLDKIDKQWKEVQVALTKLKQILYQVSSDFSFALTDETIDNAIHAIRDYADTLQALIQTDFKQHMNRRQLTTIRRSLSELEDDVDALKGELNEVEDTVKKLKRTIQSIEEQLVLQGADEVRAEIQRVQRELKETEESLDGSKDQLSIHRATLSTSQDALKRTEKEAVFWKAMHSAYQHLVEVELSYEFVEVKHTDADSIIDQLETAFKSSEKSNLLGQLSKVVTEESTTLSEYRLMNINQDIDKPDWMLQVEGVAGAEAYVKEFELMKDRRIIRLYYNGSPVNPYYVHQEVEKAFSDQEQYLDDQDRKLYEDIIVNHIGTILRSRIRRAAAWVKQMDQIMQARDNSSGLLFSIAWKPQTAETEEEMDTADLVKLLQRDSKFLSDEDLTKITKHFQSRIGRARELIQLNNQGSTLHQVLKEVLDYRKWFTFVLSFKRENEKHKKELTNNAFFQFSGGEKAMAMYIPLFTAAYSRYQEARESAPYIISLDEAFAGVDENNIRDTFEVVEQLGFDYIMNSQALWGDYDTVPSLAIAELLRPKNADFVTVMRYTWDGIERKQVKEASLDKEEETNEEYEFT